ncbi:MAG: hypothetical protein XXXNARYT_001728 [Candidatus Accumulibacter regalis]
MQKCCAFKSADDDFGYNAQLVGAWRSLVAHLHGVQGVPSSKGAAGEPAWGGALAPTREGLLAAATHGGRLLLALSAVAVLVEWMPVPELLVATHRLLQPLRRCGVDPDRSVVRLLLVMRHIETLPRPRDWRILLKAPNTGGEGEVFELADRPFSWSDPALILLVAGVVGAFLLRQA